MNTPQVVLRFSFLVDLFLSCLTVNAGVIAIVWGNRSRIFKLIAMNVSIIFVLVALELAGVVGIIDYRGMVAQTPMTPSQIDDRLRHAGHPNVRMEGDTVPDLVSWLGTDGESVRYIFETDRYGLRNPVDKDDPDVVCVGDSILAAGLLPVESITTELLERRLGVPVLSVAEVAYAPQEELIRLHSTGLDPNRLIVHFIFKGTVL